jgi:hypothetical protein
MARAYVRSRLRLMGRSALAAGDETTLRARRASRSVVTDAPKERFETILPSHVVVALPAIGRTGPLAADVRGPSHSFQDQGTVLRAAIEVARRAVRDRECWQQRQAGVGDEREHPAFSGRVPHGDHESQLGSSRMRRTSQGSALATSCRVALAVRSPSEPSGWYQGTTFQATSRSRGRLAWSPIRKKFATVSSLLSAEMNPEPRADVALRPGFSSRNSTRALVPPFPTTLLGPLGVGE